MSAAAALIPIIAVMAAESRRRVVEGLAARGATSAAAAAAFEPKDRMDRGTLRELLRTGEVREADGGYWLDEAQVERVRERTRDKLTGFGMGFLLASLGGLAITLLAVR